MFMLILALSPVLQAQSNGLDPLIGIGSILLFALLLVVDAFYIYNYYFLENSVQKLYGYRNRLAQTEMEDQSFTS